ncbi:NACHT domain-containing protein [Micromonospora chalcea]|uniref:NACHT domain-containing protein n=1 Tax=Micromonospora chalcea TaxID=1874 RepID=UPI0033DE7E0F
MADYPLTQLGTTQFEHMTQALLAAVVGALKVKVYGAGRDGGRELTTQAPFELGDGSTWGGYTVAQAKFIARTNTPDTNAAWLKRQIRSELRDWCDPKKNRRPKPDNLLFITNAVLSAVPGHGVDAVQEVFAEFPQLDLKNTAVWHYDHVCRLLDQHPSVRHAYAGLLTTGDVLTQLHRFLTGEALDVGESMRVHAAKELVAEQWLKLGSVGNAPNERLRLGQVGVDLQATVGMPVPFKTPTNRDNKTFNAGTVEVARYLLEMGDAVLRPSLSKHGGSHSHHVRVEPHLVLVGGPGQGKTTLGQLVCQAYRAALVDDLASLGPAAEVVTTLQQHLRAGDLPTPAMKRWPLRLELSKYADVLGGSPETSLLRHIATLISDRAAENITASQVKTWLQSWPWFLVLDGFDEVAAPQVREAMIDRINDFLIDAVHADADLLIVATTRPQGYNAEFDESNYKHLFLKDLSSVQAADFASKLAGVRLADDPDTQRNVIDRVKEAAEDPLTARLMRTPLQVTIMSLLLENRPRVPQDRYGLFAAYYHTIYSREMAKTTPTARLLENHQATVDEVHEQVAIRLQVAAEGRKADAALPGADVEAITMRILLREQVDEREAHRLAGRIAQAAANRLVLLVPKHLDDVGFDVRSLQEFMAARAITSDRDDDETVVQRLRVTALSSHWRNTWLLAAGRIAAGRRRLIDRVLALIDETPGAASYLDRYVRASAYLALDLLDDRFAAPSPRVDQLLLDKGIRCLEVPPTRAVGPAAASLQRASVILGSLATAVISEAAKNALAAGPPQQITALLTLLWWSAGTGGLATLGRQRASDLPTVLGENQSEALEFHFVRTSAVEQDTTVTIRRSNLDEYLKPGPGNSGLSAEDEVSLTQLLDELRACSVEEFGSERVAIVPDPPTINPEVVDAALSRAPVADYLAARMLALTPQQWGVASAIAEICRRWIQQRRVGQLLQI